MIPLIVILSAGSIIVVFFLSSERAYAGARRSMRALARSDPRFSWFHRWVFAQGKNVLVESRPQIGVEWLNSARVVAQSENVLIAYG